MANLRRIKQLFDKDTRMAVLGNGSGTVLASDGRYYIRIDGVQTVANARSGASFDPLHGKFVTVSKRADGQIEIIGTYTDNKTGNYADRSDNALDNRNTRPVTVQRVGDGLLTIRNGTMIASVNRTSGYVLYQSRWYQINDDYIDLTSYIPATSSQHLLALVYWNPNAIGLSVSVSTSKSTSYEITTSDINKAWLGCDGVPIGAVVLTNGMTELDSAIRFDLRQLVGSDGTIYESVQTVGTTTALASAVNVATNRLVSIVGSFVAWCTDNDHFVSGVFDGSAYRVLGNVALIRNNVDLTHIGGGSPALAIAVNTTYQTLEVKVTGTTGHTFNWKVRYELYEERL